MPPTIANAAQTQLWYIEEDGNGQIPSPAPEFKPIRFVSDGMTRTTVQIDSNEINPARQRPVSRQGTYHVEGEIAGEMSFGSHEDLFLAALQASGFGAQVTVTAATISAAAADNSYNDSANGFGSFVAGMAIVVAGFTGNAVNNIAFGIIATAAAGKITIASPGGDVIVDEAAGDSVTIAELGDPAIVGSTRRSFAIVERHTDIGVDYVYRNCEMNGFGFNAPIDSAALITFPVVGLSAEEYTFPGDETFAAATTTEMIVTTQGGFYEAQALIDYMTDYNLTVTNNQEPQKVLFQRPAYAVRNGRFTAEGSMSFLMPDGVLFAKYLLETQVDHLVHITEGGQSYWFRLPSVIYTQGDKPTAGEDPVIPTLTIAAGYDGVSGTTLGFYRSV
jgi:hypothetical protein